MKDCFSCKHKAKDGQFNYVCDMSKEPRDAVEVWGATMSEEEGTEFCWCQGNFYEPEE